MARTLTCGSPFWGQRSLQKTKLCKHFKRSACNRDDCSFAHAEAELKLRPDLTRTKFCERFLSKGCCDDPGCLYAHNVSQYRGRQPVEASSSVIESSKVLAAPLPPTEPDYGDTHWGSPLFTQRHPANVAAWHGPDQPGILIPDFGRVTTLRDIEQLLMLAQPEFYEE
jgi:hypothetical protein